MKASVTSFRRTLRRGYTLVELSLAMMTGMMVAAMLLAIFNQQVAFLKIFNAQSFIATEAPMINNFLSRVISSAEGYQLYNDIDTLEAGGDPQLEGARVLQLLFREPDGSLRSAVLCFEADSLYFRHIINGMVDDTQEWALSKDVAGVDFSVVEGVLRVTLTGPNQETITYSGVQQL